LTSTDEITTHLSNMLAELRKADAKAVAMIWESFLGAFIGYIMKKRRETGQNLLADISFRNIWRR